MVRHAASNVPSVGWARILALCFLALLAAASIAALVAIEAANAAATFRVANTKNSGTGSLRQAILDANAVGGVDAITFDIPGSGVKTITPASALPTIDEAVRINGYTQRPCSANPAPCSRPNTSAVGTNARLLVQLNGANTTSSPGLYIGAPNVLVKGLVINRFDGDGVELDGVENARIEGNFIGTNPGGTLDLGNTSNGVFSRGADNTVGGTVPAARNIISCNGSGGFRTTDLGNRALDNLIGTYRTGTKPLGNTGSGVTPYRNGIVGDRTASTNTIAFNGKSGVSVSNPSVSDISGNRIL